MQKKIPFTGIFFWSEIGLNQSYLKRPKCFNYPKKLNMR